MTYRPSLRVQFTAMLTVAAFLLATMSPVGVLAQPVSPAKPAPAAKPAANKGTRSLSSFVQAPATLTSGGGTTFTGLLNITGFTTVNNVLTAVALSREARLTRVAPSKPPPS